MRAAELTGKRYGKLVVIRKLSSSRGGSVLWECLCDCGNYHQASTRHLNRRGKHVVRSCGCDQHRSGSDHAQWSGYKTISGGWWSSHVKHGANCRGRIGVELTLTKEEAYELLVQQEGKCAFTGIELALSNKCRSNTASLDRIDNTRGYSKDNVQWVHKVVNMMKRIYSAETFIHWCTLVASHSRAGGVCPIR